MKIKTLVIAPYYGLVEMTSQLKEILHEFDITVVQGDLTEVIPHIQEYERNNFDIIMSRGGTARLLKAHTTLPIVEIKVSGYDIMRILTLVKGYKAKVEIIGFSNVIDSIVAIAGIMDAMVPYREVHGEGDAKAAIQQAKREGVKVVVGDAITVKKANEAGLQGVLITSGRESVLEAFEQAKIIFSNIVHYRGRNQLYRRMVDRLDEGTAIFDDNGQLQEGNAAFYQLLRSKEQPDNDRSLQRRIDFCAYVAAILCSKEQVTETAVSLDGVQTLLASGEAIAMEGGLSQYLLLRPADTSDFELLVKYSNEFVDSFPQLVTANPHFAGLLRLIQEYEKSTKYIALHGEKGSGRRLLIGASDGERRFLVEAELLYSSEDSIAALLELISRSKEDTTLCLSGCEKLDVAGARLVASALGETKARVVFCYDEPPADLYDKGVLNPRLYRLTKDYTVAVPPIREHQGYLEEYIRTFIVKYNELYGKQIVGIRSEVIQALLEHPWKGNFIELRDTVSQFVLQSSGEYIEADVLTQLGGYEGDQMASAQGKTINLNQPLEDIERDIIAKVLEEEGMSQTKAALRLGINRTTLWRKLKKE